MKEKMLYNLVITNEDGEVVSLETFEDKEVAKTELDTAYYEMLDRVKDYYGYIGYSVLTNNTFRIEYATDALCLGEIVASQINKRSLR